MLLDPPLLPPRSEDVSALTYDQLVEYLRASRGNRKGYESVLPLLKAELEARTPEKNYACMKCGHRHYEPHEIRASDGALSSIVGVEPARYRALVCQRCKFAEFYQGSTSDAQCVIDFLL